MVIETRSFCFLVKKIVINSRFGRFVHGFQETFLHRTRKMLNAYLKFEQLSDFTFFSLNFVDQSKKGKRKDTSSGN